MDPGPFPVQTGGPGPPGQGLSNGLAVRWMCERGEDPTVVLPPKAPPETLLRTPF